MSSDGKGGPVGTDLRPLLRPPGLRISSVKDRPVLRLVPDPVCDQCGDTGDPRLLDPRGVCENRRKPKPGRDCNCRSCTFGDPPTSTP